MNIRVIVPLKWESDFRIDLFSVLKKRGYTWSGGDSLDVDQQKMHNMAYIAICVDRPIISFSSKISIVEKYRGECGYNYVVVNPTIDNIFNSINFINKLLEEQIDEFYLDSFIRSHHELKDKIKLLC